MIVKGTKQLGNFKRGINLYVPKRRSAAAPSGIPTATANSIILQSGDVYAEGSYAKQGNGYFGDVGDNKLVWNGTRWEMRGDNNGLAYYNTKPNQTIDYFPDQGDWFDWIDRPASLVFVGT